VQKRRQIFLYAIIKSETVTTGEYRRKNPRFVSETGIRFIGNVFLLIFEEILYDFVVLLILEEILYGFVKNHLLIEDVSTRFGAFYHFDDLCICTSVGLASLERCDCFLCHGLRLFI
jgi:hypothetical protein